MVLFSGNTVSQLVPFIFAPIIARLYTEGQIGVYGNILAIASMVAVIAGGRFENAIVLPKEDHEAKTIFNLSFRLILSLSLLSLGLYLFKEQISSIYKDPTIAEYIKWVPLGVFFTSLNALFTQWMLRNKKYAHISIAKVMLSLGLNLSQVLLGYIAFGIEGLVIGWISGWLLSVFVLRLFGKFPFDFKLPLKELKTIAKKYKDFPTINALHAFSDIFFAQVVLLGLITSNYGVTITGVFLMMDKNLRAPVRLVGSSVGQLYYKEAAQLKNEGQSPVSIFNRSIGITTLFAIPFLVVILMWGPDIYEWYLTSKFRASGELAQVMAIPLAMNLIVSPLSSTPLIYNQQKKAFALNLIGYGLSLGSLFYAVSIGESIEVSIKYYAAGMFVYYVVLLIWYRYLIRSKS